MTDRRVALERRSIGHEWARLQLADKSASSTHLLRLSSTPMKISAIDSAFERALSAEIAASELFRVRVLAATLAVLLVTEQLLFLFRRDLVEQFTQKPLPAWLPAQIIGPFLAYEIVALPVLHYRLARGSTFPTAARFTNALIETSLPGGTVTAAVRDTFSGLTHWRMVWDIAVALDPSLLPPLFSPMTAPDEMATLWRELGMVEVEQTSLLIRKEFSSFEDYWRPFTTGESGFSERYIASLSEPR